MKHLLFVAETVLTLVHLALLFGSIWFVFINPLQAISCAVVSIGILLYVREWK